MRILRILLPALLICGQYSCANKDISPAVSSNSAAVKPLQSIASLEVPRYMGTWYQVALYPNSFQKQCVSDTTATYSTNADGTVKVLNRCMLADGKFETAEGQARPIGKLQDNTLAPAKLQVRFAPAWLSWLPFVWGNYWVISLPSDYRYVVISEPKREYLWVLSRTPSLSAADDALIRVQLTGQGFDLQKITAHKHAGTTLTNP
jgi:apolipoprotein D and lipocalin family protein